VLTAVQAYPGGALTLIIPTGTVGPVVLPSAIFLGGITNGQNAANVAISVNFCATAAAVSAANAVYTVQTLGAGQIVTFNMNTLPDNKNLPIPGIVLSFASATTGNFTVTYN
jgi:hypothetical protein